MCEQLCRLCTNAGSLERIVWFCMSDREQMFNKRVPNVGVVRMSVSLLNCYSSSHHNIVDSTGCFDNDLFKRGWALKSNFNRHTYI